MVELANFWTVPLPQETTIVYAFAVSRDGRRLERKLQREADRLQKDLWVLCHASPLPTLAPVRTYEAYALYRFRPLQVRKAQV